VNAFEKVGLFGMERAIGEFLVCFARAQLLGLKTLAVVLPELMTARGNQGILKRSEYGQYVRILKKSWIAEAKVRRN
jgi:hypothetical protein